MSLIVSNENLILQPPHTSGTCVVQKKRYFTGGILISCYNVCLLSPYSLTPNIFIRSIHSFDLYCIFTFFKPTFPCLLIISCAYYLPFFFFLILLAFYFHLHLLCKSPLSFQSPSIWASESVRAPDPPMRLGCEGAESPWPSRGGTSAPRGGSGLRLPGPPGWALSLVLHPRSCRGPCGIWGRGLPAAQRAGPEQRCEVQASVGGTFSL